MAKIPGKVSPRLLTQKLKEAMEKTYSVDDDGTVITRAERLSELLWEYALGDENNKPAPWALQLVLERVEGKVPVAQTEEQTGRLKASEKLEDNLIKRINAMSEELKDELIRNRTETPTDDKSEDLDLSNNEDSSTENNLGEPELETESDSGSEEE